MLNFEMQEQLEQVKSIFTDVYNLKSFKKPERTIVATKAVNLCKAMNLPITDDGDDGEVYKIIYSPNHEELFTLTAKSNYYDEVLEKVSQFSTETEMSEVVFVNMMVDLYKEIMNIKPTESQTTNNIDTVYDYFVSLQLDSGAEDFVVSTNAQITQLNYKEFYKNVRIATGLAKYGTHFKTILNLQPLGQRPPVQEEIDRSLIIILD